MQGWKDILLDLSQDHFQVQIHGLAIKQSQSRLADAPSSHISSDDLLPCRGASSAFLQAQLSSLHLVWSITCPSQNPLFFTLKSFFSFSAAQKEEETACVSSVEEGWKDILYANIQETRFHQLHNTAEREGCLCFRLVEDTELALAPPIISEKYAR